MYLRDIIDDSAEAGDMLLEKKRELYNISIISRGMTVFQLLMTFERVYTIWKLGKVNRPSKNEVLGFALKALLFEEGTEVLNLAAQTYLQYEMEVIKQQCMSQGLFMATVSTSILEIIFGIMEARQPISDFNDQNPDESLKLYDIFICDKSRRSIKENKVFMYILAFCLASSFFITDLISVNPLPQNCFEERIGEITGDNNEIFKISLGCLLCNDFHYLSDDQTSCSQDDCTKFDIKLVQNGTRAGRCECKDHSRAMLPSKYDSLFEKENPGMCTCRDIGA